MSGTEIARPHVSHPGSSMAKQAPSERQVEFVQAVMNRGLSLFRSGQFDSADVLFESMASTPAVRPLVQHIRGVIALHRGNDEQALELIEEAISLNPADGEAHANLGLLLLKNKQEAQALAAYASALTLQPDNAAAQFGLARSLAALGLTEFAFDAFRDVLARAPDYLEAAVDFGTLLNDMGRHDEAVATLRDILDRHPGREEMRTALSACLFATGDWPAAWTEYEWRLNDPELCTRMLSTDRPRWQGEELAGKTILLQTEQGLGDTLQFVRYAAMVKARGGHVIVRAPNPLLPVLRTVAGVDTVFDTEARPSFDVHVPLLSLPLIFGTDIDTVPAEIPYIKADPELVTTWRERLGAHSGISVGLVWQGNPEHPNDRRRSIRLEALRPLLDCSGVRFVSLQVGAGQDQVKGLEQRIVDPSNRIDPASFADAAAIIANLDLVISIDSAIAHLAGALGKPVWIMLAESSDWRWLRGRDDTPWYPRARLFRQSTTDDWTGVVKRLRAELWSFAGAAAPPPADTVVNSIAAVALRMTIPPRATNAVLCDALFVEACRQHRMKNLERCRRLFEKILLLDPRHVNTLCNLGALEVGAGHLQRALALLDTAVVLAPELAPVRMALADALLQSKKTEQGLAHYRKAIELEPGNAAVHSAYAAALQGLGEIEQAAVHFDQARKNTHRHYGRVLADSPNNDAIHAECALALHRLGDVDGAMNHFLAATRINQHQSPEFYEALGRTCAVRGNSEGAEISLKHALALDPQLVSAHCALGELYLARGRRADAETSFRGALAVDAGCVTALRGIEQLSM